MELSLFCQSDLMLIPTLSYWRPQICNIWLKNIVDARSSSVAMLQLSWVLSILSEAVKKSSDRDVRTDQKIEKLRLMNQVKVMLGFLFCLKASGL